MPVYVDQLNNAVELKNGVPKRIVSLVPSQTELLHYLGQEEEVVGITKFCIHPHSWFTGKVRVGGTKAVHIDAVGRLNPDLIIANKEENVKEQVGALKAIAPVWVSDINTLDDALDMIERIGAMLDKTQQAQALITQVKSGFLKLADEQLPAVTNLIGNPAKPRIAYFIWRGPYMTAGGDTFIGDMLRRCGFNNVFEQEKRYPEVKLEQLKVLNCQYIFLSSEPFPFKEKHAAEIQQLLPAVKIIFVDGEMFSWYGSRLLQAVQYFKELKQQLNSNAQYRV